MRFEGLVKRPRLDEAAHTAVQSLLLVCGGAGVWLRRRRLRDDQALLAVAGSVVLVYTIFFPTTRLLAPAMFVSMFYGGGWRWRR